MNYKIWKASLDTYRVFNVKANRMLEVQPKYLILKNCTFKVDLEKAENSKLASFKNTGEIFDYFAWIACEEVEFKREPNVFERLSDSVLFNPFKDHTKFTCRTTGKELKTARFVFIEGNKLKYSI